MIVVLDTHCWFWFLNADPKLGASAPWEISMLVAWGRGGPSGIPCTGGLEIHPPAAYNQPMSNTTRILPDPDDDEAAECAALAAAVAESDTDPRVIPHSEMRAWLLEIAAGHFDAPPPTAREHMAH